MAIKIIKPGRPGEIKRFTCSRCGCVFEAGRDDYEKGVSDISLKKYAEVACPFCGYFVRRPCDE